MIRAALFTIAFATPAAANVDSLLNDYILPSWDSFAASAAELADQVGTDCSPENVAPYYNDAFDHWLNVRNLKLGPTENGTLNIEFWPDDRGFIPRTLADLIADQDPIAYDADEYATMSIAARGLMSIEMLVFDDRFNGYGAEDYTCDLLKQITADFSAEVARQSGGWANDYAPIMLGQGDGVTTPVIDEEHAFATFYTQIVSGLENLTIQNVNRPLGTFDRPRETRANAWRSDRALRNIVLSADAMTRQAQLLMGTELPVTTAALGELHETATRVTDPSFANIETDTQAWLLLQILGQNVDAIGAGVSNEIGLVMGISAGFNASDGD